MNETLTALLLGLLEGLTEFIPVSSTGHLLLAGHFLGFRSAGRTFEVVIQLGAVLAILGVYAAKISRTVRGLPSDPGARRFAGSVLLAFLPAAVIGALAVALRERGAAVRRRLEGAAARLRELRREHGRAVPGAIDHERAAAARRSVGGDLRDHDDGEIQAFARVHRALLGLRRLPHRSGAILLAGALGATALGWGVSCNPTPTPSVSAASRPPRSCCCATARRGWRCS